jgi:AraC family transcriptional regulator, regulatory protein of adaptative response / methylated-DNA-[protein]-cysteine methyltransferase
MLDPETCWQAVQQRDARQDGTFYFGVLTTGVYCRPSCAARRPLRRNVRFYASPDEAERDGLRACRRCHPRDLAAAGRIKIRIQALCRHIEEHADEPLPLNELAAAAGLSLFQLQKQFKAIVGVTPKQFVEAARLKKLKHGLRQAKDVTVAIYDAGYGSSSRVYERADTRLGMTPKQYRLGGAGVVITYAGVDSPIGRMMIGATDRGLCFVQFADTDEALLSELRREYPAARLEAMREPHHPDFRRWLDALTRHLAGRQPHLELPLDLRATAFQMRVWNYLQSIPYGEVRSYGEVAAAIGQPTSTRAVASACAKNRVAVLIPCHRVIRGTGELGGYRWGLARKRALIDRERAVRAAAR